MMARIRRYFVAGLLVWLPLVATYLVLAFSIRLIDRSLLLLPPNLRPENLIGFKIPGLGVILTILLVLITGLIVANFFGRRLVVAWESLLSRIPLVRSVYGMLAFVTGDTPKDFQKVVGRDLINIYVPTTPNPTSGFYIMVPPSDIKRLDVPVEVGLKMILSAGVVNPLDDPIEAEKIAAEIEQDQKNQKKAARGKKKK